MPHPEHWPFRACGTELLEDGKAKGESSILQKQVGDMEGVVEKIRRELEEVKKDRHDLHNRRTPNSMKPDITVSKGFCSTDAKVHEDSKYSKLSEISKLREELIRTKNSVNDETHQREKYGEKLTELEQKLNTICLAGFPHDRKGKQNLEDENSTLKLVIRDMKEEMEELKISMSENNEQLQDYRVKYLQAQQEAVEYKRQLDIIDYDNKQVSDQIQIEIQKMKMQFQEKLQELSPLPDLLKGAHMQLQEAKELQKLAEDNSDHLSNELHRVKEKLVTAANKLSHEHIERAKDKEDNNLLKAALNAKQDEICELNKGLDEFKCMVLRLEEKLGQLEMRYQEKASEAAQLSKDLDELRVENNRFTMRTKERSDAQRRYLQTQISELERQLISSRAQCRAFQKERDEMRQRMQMQVHNLQENFELGEIRLRGLQGQLTSLKSSYMVLADDEDDELKLVTS